MEDDILDPEHEDSENESSSDAEVKSAISADLIRGHINTIILRTLYERDKYGYEIIEEIETKSHGQYSLKQPTLYSALKRLESQGYINAYWKTDDVSQGGRRKYYTLTDSGREITERNQAEWEYSRTVIDNLISDRNFDFSQPAPTAVDFKILKSSTSRVPTGKDYDDKDEREITYDEPAVDQVVEIKREDATDVVVTETDTSNNTVSPEQIAEVTPQSEPQPEPQFITQTESVVQPLPPIQPQYIEVPVQQVQYVQQIPLQQIPVQQILVQQAPVQQIPVQPVQYTDQAPAEQSVRDSNEISEEQRRILHENYLKLISEPTVKKQDTPETPYAENIDTDKLLYNNRPEPERDYKNLINNLFINSIKQESAPVAPITPAPQPEPVAVEQPTPVRTTVIESVRIDDATEKAREDGLTIGTSEFYTIENRRKRYNLGSAMFKSSIIVGIIMLLEFTLCFIFRNKLGATPDAALSIAYPFVILALAITQVLIFGSLYFAGVGKSSKPSALIYITSCIILTVIAVFAIFIVSLLLNVNFAYAGDIMAKIVIPCIVALNITVFGFILYLFSRR